ncbi:UPF0738 family protein [Rossellomorea vietnamensis]|uniref:UPF0738 family protein n=1 Tax=Rossellomorea vietnamensis TaxID=218284 RepID=UPI001E2914AD|nr:hypothetical protein [Rossellomorea vietnamensis]MCC5804516.1 hypothetical protein [Rossellomorea vietnamensis]
MRKIIQFNHTTYEKGTLYLHTDQPELLKGTTAAGQIIADSDRYAFVYLAENEEEYVYLYLEESIWPELKKALHEKAAVLAKSEKDSLELTQFIAELEYLIDNIEGNGNYGDEMVNKVENVFLEK